MDESTFHKRSDQWFTTAQDVLEGVDLFDVEYQYGVLTVILPSGQTFVINKQTPARQIWFSSPVSGGLHFSYQDSTGKWRIPDGRVLEEVLACDIKTLSDVVVTF